MKRWYLFAIAVVLVAVGCGKDPVSPGAPPRITALPRALTAQEQQIIQADNRFAIKLLKETYRGSRDTLPNLFVSPLSVAMALGMTYNGAATTTEAAMRSTLELDSMTVDEVNQANQSLIALLRGLDPRVQFEIANSIWYRLGFAVEQSFLDANRTYYDARVDGLDFNAPTAVSTINAWVNDQTHGKIKDIIQDIPPEVVMYLINAIYFKGDWTQQFDKNLTAPLPFHLQDGSTVSVPTMTYGAKAAIRTTATPTARVIDLPYGGAAFSMTIVLPDENVTVDSVLSTMTLNDWNTWMAALDSANAELYLPKFKLENSLSLVNPLTRLGMGVAFSDFADFSKINGTGGLTITDVLHKTYVDVNEEGTEAAAVTAVGIGLTCACEPPPVRVDRPFVFALRENLSGTILFMGVIRQPPAAAQ
jgi:serine protease inhibitor